MRCFIAPLVAGNFSKSNPFSGKHHILNLQMNLVSHSKCIVEGIAQHCKSSRSLIYVYQRNKDVHNYMRSLS